MEGMGTSVPPLKKHVLIYFSQKNIPETVALNFYDYFQKKRWRNQRCVKMANWKIAAWNWILNLL
ncbi:MAG: hypothetical protein JWM28_2361 [Chitinophagaceae bacterium]|nr:hypothetical protein [Chitinophagaceae bacterium]